MCCCLFTSKFNLQRHVARWHSLIDNRQGYVCGVCDAIFRDKNVLQQHREEQHGRHTGFRIVSTAHERSREIFRLFIPEKYSRHLVQVLAYVGVKTTGLLKALAAVTPMFKLTMSLFLEMEKIDLLSRQVLDRELVPFRSKSMAVTRANFENSALENMSEALKKIDCSVDEFLSRGSGWRVKCGAYLDVEFALCRTMSATNSSLPHICKQKTGKRGKIDLVLPMPEEFNCFKNMSKNCFYFAVAAGLMGCEKERRDENAVRSVVENRLVKVHSSDTAVSADDIPKFEELNQHLSIAVNVVYIDEEGDVLPVFASKNVHASNVVVLALFHIINEGVDDGEMTGGAGKKKWGAGYTSTSHFALVENPNQLFAKRFAKAKGDDYNRTVQVEICWKCHSFFDRRQTYLNHVEFCHKKGNQHVRKKEGWKISNLI